MTPWFRWGAALGALAVAMGAFGAHGLEGRVSPDMQANWETAARYHMYHALALVATAFAADRWPGRLTRPAGWLFLVGILLFSGSLYVMVLTDVRLLGAVTPFGGVCFIAGWVCLLLTPPRR